ncbi:glycosyltransferase family 9 protein [Elusimicrobiota bacterium]
MRGNIAFKVIDRCLGIIAVFLLGIITRICAPKVKEDVKNILIIKLSALGDTILLSPVLKALKEHYKNAKITAIGTEINREVWERMPCVDDSYILNIRKIFNPCVIFKILRKLRKGGFDIVIDCDQWLRISAIFAVVTGAPERIGFNTKGQYKHFGFTKSLEHSQNTHELDCFIGLCGLLGVEVKDRSISFQVTGEDEGQLDDILSGYELRYTAEKYAVIHPGCGGHGWQREWPAERYSAICNTLIQKYNYKIVLTGGDSEAGTVRSVADGVSGTVINMQGKLGLGPLAVLLRTAAVFISGNTGIMHLAAAVGTRCIALHGPTDFQKWGPVGSGHKTLQSPVSCSPCLYLGYEYGCKTRRCMENISVEAIENIVRECLVE